MVYAHLCVFYYVFGMLLVAGLFRVLRTHRSWFWWVLLFDVCNQIGLRFGCGFGLVCAFWLLVWV